MKKQVSEGSLHKWFKGSKSKDGKGGWVNVVTGGTCASDKPGEGTPKCVSSSKRASMSKSERLSAARRKKKADPGQQQKSGAAKPTYVSTDKKKKKMKESYTRALAPLSEKAQKCWKGYEKKGTKKMFGKTYNNCVKKEEVEIVDEAMSSYDKNRKAAAKRAADRNAARRRGELGGRMERETYRSEGGTQMHYKGYKANANEEVEMEAVNSAQQAAIAIAKKKKKEDDMVAMKKKKQKIMSSYDWRSELDYVDEAYGGRGVSRKAKLASIHPPTAEAAKKNIPTETDRGSGNKAKKRMKKMYGEEIKLPNIKTDVKMIKGIRKGVLPLDQTKINSNLKLSSQHTPEGETIEEGDKKGKGSGSKDACYHKVKSRYSVWPSAYASGALVKCRKVGAANWGNSSKKEDLSDWKGEFIWEDGDSAKKIDENILKKLRGKKDVDPYIDLDIKPPRQLPLGKQFYDPEDNFSGPKPDKLPKPSISPKPDIKLDKPSLATQDSNMKPDIEPDKPIPPISGGLDNMETIPGKPGRIRPKPGSLIGRMPILPQKPGSPIGRMLIRPNTSGFIGRKSIIRSHYDWREELNLEGKNSLKKIDEASSPAWQRKEGKSESGGLNKKGVASYRAANPGSKLKTAVTAKPSTLKRGSKSAKRRKSFCSRMKGMKKKLTSAKTARDPDSRINKALRKWNC